MKTDIITLLEIAGVDPTQGKAKTLVENTHNRMLKHYESYLNEIPVEDLVDEIFEYGLDGGDSEEEWATQDIPSLIDTLLDHMGSSSKDLAAWIQANPITEQLLESNDFHNWATDPRNEKAIAALRSEVDQEFSQMSREDKDWVAGQGPDLGDYESWKLFPGYGDDDQISGWVEDLTIHLISQATAS